LCAQEILVWRWRVVLPVPVTARVHAGKDNIVLLDFRDPSLGIFVILQARIEAAKQKAEVIAAQEDLSAKQREKQMAMIMARAKSGKGAGKVKLSRSAAYSQKKKRKPLDKRQRADQRQVCRMT
jgi:hypothetical protein